MAPGTRRQQRRQQNQQPQPQQNPNPHLPQCNIQPLRTITRDQPGPQHFTSPSRHFAVNFMLLLSLVSPEESRTASPTSSATLSGDVSTSSSATPPQRQPPASPTIRTQIEITKITLADSWMQYIMSDAETEINEDGKEEEGQPRPGTPPARTQQIIGADLQQRFLVVADNATSHCDEILNSWVVAPDQQGRPELITSINDLRFTVARDILDCVEIVARDLDVAAGPHKKLDVASVLIEMSRGEIDAGDAASTLLPTRQGK